MSARSLADQWRDYGDRPPIARWTSRVSLIIGLLIGVALTALMLSLVVWLIVAIWRWVL